MPFLQVVQLAPEVGKVGELVTLPALGWTCLMSTAGARPIFTCTRDRKPIVSATITATSVIVGSSHRPIRVRGGYRFPY